MKKMTKNILSVVIAASIGASSIPMHALASEQGTIQVVSSVNFREQPTTNGNNQIRFLKTGEKLEIIGQPNSYWYHVKDQNGRTGYVSSSSKYVTAVAAASTQNSLRVVNSVNFRKQPTTKGNNQIRFLKKGEVVTIIEQHNSHWYKVRDKNGTVGYVSSSSKYVTKAGSGSSSNGSNNGSSSNAPASTKVENVIKAGQKYLGTPYEFGSNRNSTRTFDCSDFVRRAFIDGMGLTLPSDSRKQGDYVKKVGKTSTNWKNLKRGDLMFFMSYKGTSKSSYPSSNKLNQRITHVSIYLGNGKMLHTYSKESGGVRVDSIANKHWEYRFMFGGSAF